MAAERSLGSAERRSSNSSLEMGLTSSSSQASQVAVRGRGTQQSRAAQPAGEGLGRLNRRRKEDVLAEASPAPARAHLPSSPAQPSRAYAT